MEPGAAVPVAALDCCACRVARAAQLASLAVAVRVVEVRPVYILCEVRPVASLVVAQPDRVDCGRKRNRQARLTPSRRE